jgi:lipopolysaccharide kinase (Kdo/WaaP) family protein
MASTSNLRFRRGLDPELVRLRFGRRVLHLRRGLEPHAAALVSALENLDRSNQVGEGNRQSTFRLALPGAPEMVARSARRGGLIRFLLADLHFGIDPRPLRELQVTLEARRRGIPVADPMGAMVDWLAPLAYRGFFLTRALSGLTLWELIRTDDDPRVRAHVLEQARRAIEIMHGRGLFHADLNLHNLFVTKAGESFAVIILDLDKARLLSAPLAAGLRRANAERLVRSARKLDPAGRFLDARALSILKVA